MEPSIKLKKKEDNFNHEVKKPEERVPQEEFVTGDAAEILIDIIENPKEDPERESFIRSSLVKFNDVEGPIKFILEVDKKRITKCP